MSEWLSGMIYGYHFNFISPFSIEKCLEILEDESDWSSLIRRNDSSWYRKVIINHASDDLYLFEIHLYQGRNRSAIEIIGVLQVINHHVRVIGRSRITDMVNLILIVYGCIAMGLTLIFASTPLSIMGFGWLVVMAIVIYQTLAERYKVGNYPEKWLKGRGLPQIRL